jgi:hypothetical protein
VLNLPARPDHAAAALLVLGMLAGLACGILLWRRLLPAAGGGDGRVAAAVLAFAFGSTIAGAPFIAWRVYVDIRLNSRLTSAQAERVGGDAEHIDHRAIERAAATIPAGDTYFVALPTDMTRLRRLNGRRWALTALMPRIQVYDARKADWIFAWDRDPARVGVPVGGVIRFTVGAPEPPTRFALARVER